MMHLLFACTATTVVLFQMLLLSSKPAVLSAFVVPPPPPAAAAVGVSSRSQRVKLFQATSESEDPRKEVMDNKIKNAKAVAEDKETEWDMTLTKEMLETALEFVHTEEMNEDEHVSKAHAMKENAILQEKALEAAVAEAHHDASEAEELLKQRYSSDGKLGEDAEIRREMAMADISHQVENYAQGRLQEAKEAELRATEEEAAAIEHLEELHEHEDTLKATLEEFNKASWDKKLEDVAE